MIFSRNGKKLQDPVHLMWRHFLEFKLVLAIFLTPMVYPFTTMFAEEGEKNIDEPTRRKI